MSDKSVLQLFVLSDKNSILALCVVSGGLFDMFALLMRGEGGREEVKHALPPALVTPSEHFPKRYVLFYSTEKLYGQMWTISMTFHVYVEFHFYV